MTATALTTHRIAAALDCSVQTVRRLADRGDLPARRLTPRSPRRYKLEDVRRLLEATRPEGAS